MKYDSPYQIKLVEQFLKIYRDVKLFPQIQFASQDNTYLVYAFIEGKTHVDRGIKSVWLRELVQGLFNKYIIYEEEAMWGRIEYPRRTWQEFNEISISFVFLK